jgi:hypothetical protein
VAFTGTCPCFCLLCFLKADNQLIIFKLPETLIHDHYTAKALVQERRVALDAHCQLLTLKFDRHLRQLLARAKLFAEFISVFRQNKWRGLNVDKDFFQVLVPTVK